MAAMLPSKSKSGLSDSSTPKSSPNPATPRRPSTPKSASKERPSTPKSSSRERPSTPKSVNKLNRVGSVKSDPHSPLTGQTPNPRLSFDRSPKSIDSSKNGIDKRSPKTPPPPDKLQARSLKVQSELQSQLDSAHEDLKKAKDQLASIEKEKLSILNELESAKHHADTAKEQLQEALLAKTRAEEAIELEKFRADELEMSSLDAAQNREDEWKREMEKIKSEHESDINVLVDTKEDLERVKHELEISIEEKKAAIDRADMAMQDAEVNIEKAEFLSGELNRLKSLLDSSLENKTSEKDQIVNKLKGEIVRLQGELENERETEKELIKMEEVLERLKIELGESKKAELAASSLVEEWRGKAEELEVRLEEASESEKCKAVSLSSAMEHLEAKETLLSEKEIEICDLKEKTNELETQVGMLERELAESNKRFDNSQQEVFEMETQVDMLRTKLESSEEEKLEAIKSEKEKDSQLESLREEKESVMEELERIKLDGENDKKAMEDLTLALHEISEEKRETTENLLKKENEFELTLAQIGDLKLSLKNTKENYEIMLDEANYEITCLRKTLEKLESESKTLKNHQNSKEDEVFAANKQSEEEIIALRVQVDKVSEALKCTEIEARNSDEEKIKLNEKLEKAEVCMKEVERSMEEMRMESTKLRERLLDKENELQSVVQENEELRGREVKALERIDVLSSKLEEVVATQEVARELVVEDPVEEHEKLEENEKEEEKDEEDKDEEKEEEEKEMEKTEEVEMEKEEEKLGNGINSERVENGSAKKKSTPLSKKIGGFFKRKNSHKNEGKKLIN